MKDKKKIGRREFLKVAGTGAAVTTAALYGCKPRSAGSASEADGARQGQMTYRTNPKTGERVSLLGYGCMRWPTVSGSDDIDQEMVNALVDHAIAHGVNYFDTSPAMYRNSFRELQVDYIDYLLLHGVGMGSGMEEFEARYIDNGMLDFLLAEREAGRIRNLGFSYHGDIAVFDHLLAQHDRYKWDFVQIQLNYVDWKHAKEVNTRNTDAEYLYGELEKRGIPTVIMEPLLGGRLSNVHDHIAAHLKQRRPSSSVASWAFRFAGSFPGVLTVLSGMTYMEHLQDNLRTYSPLDELTDDDKEFLEQTAQLMLRYPTIPCNDCKYCMPCPYGLDIPAILLHYNKCVNEGNVATSSQDENYRRARRAFLVGYDRSVPKLRQASHCIGCNQCVPHCPQNIRIPQELHRIDRFAEHLKQDNL